MTTDPHPGSLPADLAAVLDELRERHRDARAVWCRPSLAFATRVEHTAGMILGGVHSPLFLGADDPPDPITRHVPSGLMALRARVLSISGASGPTEPWVPFLESLQEAGESLVLVTPEPPGTELLETLIVNCQRRSLVSCAVHPGDADAEALCPLSAAALEPAASGWAGQPPDPSLRALLPLFRLMMARRDAAVHIGGPREARLDPIAIVHVGGAEHSRRVGHDHLVGRRLRADKLVGRLATPPEHAGALPGNDRGGPSGGDLLLRARRHLPEDLDLALLREHRLDHGLHVECVDVDEPENAGLGHRLEVGAEADSNHIFRNLEAEAERARSALSAARAETPASSTLARPRGGSSWPTGRPRSASCAPCCVPARRIELEELASARASGRCGSFCGGRHDRRRGGRSLRRRPEHRPRCESARRVRLPDLDLVDGPDSVHADQKRGGTGAARHDKRPATNSARLQSPP